jgi:myosin protein heavy chain
VWVPDPTEGFLPGWIKSQSGEDGSPDATAEVVIATSGEVRTVPLYQLSPMNPPQFDGVEDIADLTHLNEASVINNLKMRYGAGSIYVSPTRTFNDKPDLVLADLLRVCSTAVRFR